MISRAMKIHLQLVALLLASSIAGFAEHGSSRLYRFGGEWIQEVTGTLPSANMVRVHSSAGSIHVTGAKGEGVRYVIREHVRAITEEAARREISRMHFTAVSAAGVAKLQADCEGTNGGYIDFELQVPAQTEQLKLETRGGAVSAKNVAGRVEASTGGGKVQLDQIGGVIWVSSDGGEVEIGKAGSDVRVIAGSGNIHIGSAAGRVNASSGGGNLAVGAAKVMSLETGAGSISVVKCDGGLKAVTGGGTVDLKEVSGPAQVESAGGGIRIGTIRGGLRVATASGPIIATLAQGSGFTDSRLETSMGDIVVYVPDGLGVTVKAAVEQGRGEGISSEFPELKVTRARGYGPMETFAEGSINGGGPILHVHTSSGRIQFKRKGKE